MDKIPYLLRLDEKDWYFLKKQSAIQRRPMSDIINELIKKFKEKKEKEFDN